MQIALLGRINVGNMMLSAVEKYEICRANDTDYDGKFYIGVLSTKIYCLPSCKARFPLFKNVQFFDTRDEAIARGLRGCQRCKSEFFPHTDPEWLERLLELLHTTLDRKLSSEALEECSGVNISTIQRYFREYRKMPVTKFHRIIRLNHAKQLILDGQDLLDIPYMVGFDSLSGFRSAFSKHFGINPGEMKP